MATDAADQIAIDAETLAEVIPGLERLEAAFNVGRQEIRPLKRGYFTPDEDDRVRQLLLTYRNYRISIWDMLWRYREYYKLSPTTEHLRGYIVGYAAALKLYEKSLKVIDVVEYDPMLRAKLNEPDRKFALEGDFFEGVLRSYSSISNYSRMMAASAYFVRHRSAIRALEDDPTVGWLVPIIVATRDVLAGKFFSIVWRRVKRDWRGALRLFWRPVAFVRYQSQATVASAIAALHVAPGHRPAVGPLEIAELQGALEPGDVLLMRADDKVTAALLPGFWSHAAIYVGGRDALARLGLAELPHVSRLDWIFERFPSPMGYVIEAVAQGCRLHKLHHSLRVDHVAVLRPRLDAQTLREALREAGSRRWGSGMAAPHALLDGAGQGEDGRRHREDDERDWHRGEELGGHVAGGRRI